MTERAYVLREPGINKFLLLAASIDINLKLVRSRCYRFISKANRARAYERTRARTRVVVHAYTYGHSYERSNDVIKFLQRLRSTYGSA